MTAMDLICVGEILVDFIPGGLPDTYVRRAGGAPANVAIAAARNGLQAAMCGRVGADALGRFLAESLNENKVAFLTPSPVEDAVTTMAIVSLDESGERSFTFVRKPGADMFLTRDDISQCRKYDYTILHAGSCSLSKGPAADATVYAIMQAKEQNRIVSFDINYREHMWDGNREKAIRAVRDIYPCIDLLKFSEEEADFIEPNLLYSGQFNGVAVKTLGKMGAEMYWRGKRYSVAGRNVTCIDTTGAGDAFWGAFLSCILKAGVKSMSVLNENVLIHALNYANIAGSLCVQKKGATEAMPSSEEVDALMENL